MSALPTWLLRLQLRSSRTSRRVVWSRWMKDIFNWRHPADSFLGENAKLQRKRTSEFAVEIDRTSAHAGDHASVLNLLAFELNQNDRLLGPEKIRHHADDFEIEFLDLIAREIVYAYPCIPGRTWLNGSMSLDCAETVGLSAAPVKSVKTAATARAIHWKQQSSNRWCESALART